MKKIDRSVSHERSMDIVKSNTLIQKTRYNLSVQEQKIILYLISKIKPEDTGLMEYTLEIKDFCKLTGIDWNSGTNYKRIKDTLQKLRNKSFWIQQEDKEVLVGWLSNVYLQTKSGTVTLKLDEFLKPYLIELKQNFTQYSLYYILAMKSHYSIRLYELLKSYQGCKQWTFNIDDLKRKLDGENYKRYQDFRRKVLEIALREIDLYTDLDIKYELIKNGRKYEKITFFINQKKESMNVIQNVQLMFNELCPWDR